MKYLAVATATAISLALALALVDARAQMESSHPAVRTVPGYSKLESKLSSPLSLEDVHAITDAAERAVARDDHAAAGAMYEAILESAWFAHLETDRQRFALASAAEVASIQGDYSRAHTLYARSSGYALAGQDDWMGRLNAAWFVGDHDDAVAALLKLARHWPDELEYVSQWAIDALLAHARNAPGEAEFTVLAALFEVGWETDIGLEPTHLWMRFIELLVEREEIDRAVTVSARLRDPLAIVTILSDKRFAGIVAAAPDWFDVGETLDAGIIEARLAVEDNPHLLAPSITLAESLLRAGRPQDSLLVIDTQMARSALKTVVGKALEDATTESVHALTTKALALIALQRWDDAGAQLELAAEQSLPAHRSGDYYAVALLQARLGLPDAALATLQRVAADPGDPQAELIRFIVAQTQSNAGAAAAALEALLASQSDAAAQAQRALLLAGHVDEAAELLIRRLNDPAQRVPALLELQGMREQAWPEEALDWRARVGSLMSRDDVRRSVAATGAIISDYALYRWN